MKQLRFLGLLIVVLSLLAPLFWMVALFSKHDALAVFSQYIGIGALIAMAWGQLIATRFKIVEHLFGGLDRGYVLHKWLGIFAIISVLLHDTIDADIDGIGVETLLSDIAETFGEISLYGLLVLVVISVATFIPYHLWRWTHKFMGLFFMLGAFHYLFILKPFANFDPLGVYVTFFCLVGISAFLYRLIPSAFRPTRSYIVTDISNEAGALCLQMSPEGKAVNHRAGQFAFLEFPENISKEPHPFTISSAPNASGTLQFTIADLGDFTGRDLMRLKSGDQIKVEGPFGGFLRQDKKEQIWIAGGIGVTPFAAWAEDISGSELKHPVTLYYCVKASQHAAHLRELQKCARDNENFSLVVVESSKGMRLSAEMIAKNHGAEMGGIHFCFCGPASMRKDLEKSLSRFGVSARQFHFEEFEIRSGIGLRRLASFVMGKLLSHAAINKPNVQRP